MRMSSLRGMRVFMQAPHQQTDLFARQVTGRIGLGKTSLGNDGDVGRHLEDLVEILADDDDGRTGFCKIDESLANTAFGTCVHAPCRLVDDEDSRLAIKLAADDE